LKEEKYLRAKQALETYFDKDKVERCLKRHRQMGKSCLNIVDDVFPALEEVGKKGIFHVLSFRFNDIFL